MRSSCKNGSYARLLPPVFVYLILICLIEVYSSLQASLILVITFVTTEEEGEVGEVRTILTQYRNFVQRVLHPPVRQQLLHILQQNTSTR